MLIPLLRCAVALFALSLPRIASGQCTASSSLSGSSFVNNAGVGSFAWGSPENAVSSNNVRASAGILLGVFSSANSNYLIATGFGFSIPSYASVCGIEVMVEKSAGGLGLGSSIIDNAVYLVKGGSITGSNQASGSSWSGSDGLATYGGSGSLWGTTWTPAEINSGDFGLAFSARLRTGVLSLTQHAQIDNISIVVHYFTTVLPVSLVDFELNPRNNKVELSWATLSEENTSRFIVQCKSPQMVAWHSIDSIPAKHFSEQKNNYKYTDQHPPDNGLYRIACVDADGKTSYSSVLKSALNVSKVVFNIYPNPGNGRIMLKSEEPLHKVTILNSLGHVCYTGILPQPQFQHFIDMHQQPPGVYVVRITTVNKTDSRLLMIKH
ncbi:MAG: T9SS type A sorting domain-containing protein [Chitinophagaceae bacterium]|nr:T9SS type A sorting domain-containing protein [Chitinophagaceae bacterium]